MTDIVDFRVSDTLAIGHDDLNVIVFKKVGPARARGTSFEGHEWRAVNFVYKDKRVLLRCLRELGWSEGPETLRELASMPEDLRTYRAGLRSLAVTAPQAPALAEAA